MVHLNENHIKHGKVRFIIMHLETITKYLLNIIVVEYLFFVMVTEDVQSQVIQIKEFPYKDY